MANNDAVFTFTGLQNTVRADIVLGNTYGRGPAFGANSNRVVANGTVSFTGLANPAQPQAYTVRLFSSGGTCTTDVVVTLRPADCPCLIKFVVPAILKRVGP